jgi:hypothetical protein
MENKNQPLLDLYMELLIKPKPYRLLLYLDLQNIDTTRQHLI